MKVFKWKFNGKNFVCDNEAGQLIHCFSPEQMEGYRSLMAKIPTVEELAILVQAYKDSLPKPVEKTPVEDA